MVNVGAVVSEGTTIPPPPDGIFIVYVEVAIAESVIPVFVAIAFMVVVDPIEKGAL